MGQAGQGVKTELLCDFSDCAGILIGFLPASAAEKESMGFLGRHALDTQRLGDADGSEYVSPGSEQARPGRDSCPFRGSSQTDTRRVPLQVSDLTGAGSLSVQRSCQTGA